MRKIFMLVSLALIVAVGSSQSREVQKVGTTSMQTLKVPTSVRAIGMAEAFCAVADDIQSVFWNPAGLIYLTDKSAYFSQINMPADIQFNSAAIASGWGRNRVLGLHVIAMNTGDMPVRTIFRPEGTGENFIAYDLVVGGSYAQRLTDRFSFGANVRVIRSGIEEESYTGLIADMGTLYQTALRSLRIGFAIQNFGPDIDYSGSYLDYLDQGRRGRAQPQENNYHAAPPPTIYRIGLAGNLFELAGVERPAMWDGIFSVEMSHPNDNRERINFGCEVSFMEMLFLRAGHKLRLENTFGYDEQRWAAGLGLKIPLTDAHRVAFDYAYQGFGIVAEAADGFMESPHRFSITFNF